jgi:hypothetical protein
MVDAIFGIMPYVIVVIAIVLLIVIARWQRSARRSTVRVFITNEGNLRSRFNLRAESAGSDLAFRFALNGASLPATYTPAPAAPFAPATSAPAAYSVPATPEAASSYSIPEPKGPPLASLIADLLMGVGYILPGSAGQGLMSAASRIRYGQAVTDRAGKVAGRVGAVAGSTARTGQQIASTAAGGAPGAGQAANTPASFSASQPSGPVITWWQTPFLEPAAALALDLTIIPTGSTSPRNAAFRIVSRGAEFDDSPLVTSDATTRIGGPAGLGRWIPYLAVIFLAIVAIALLATVRSLLASLIGG